MQGNASKIVLFLCFFFLGNIGCVRRTCAHHGLIYTTISAYAWGEVIPKLVDKKNRISKIKFFFLFFWPKKEEEESNLGH